jgi:hypothetical protein
LIAALIVCLIFVVVGYISVLAQRIIAVVRATVLVGRIQWFPIILIAGIILVLPVSFWLIMWPITLPLLIPSIVAAVIGIYIGRLIAESEARKTPHILKDLARLLVEYEQFSPDTEPSNVKDSSMKFVNGSPPFMTDILVSVVLVFNSPWTSFLLGKGFRSFQSKSMDEREAYITRWATDQVLRFPLEFIKIIINFGIYDQNTVWTKIGYSIPLED